jgi:hypothetical protein
VGGRRTPQPTALPRARASRDGVGDDRSGHRGASPRAGEQGDAPGPDLLGTHEVRRGVALGKALGEPVCVGEQAAAQIRGAGVDLLHADLGAAEQPAGGLEVAEELDALGWPEGGEELLREGGRSRVELVQLPCTGSGQPRTAGTPVGGIRSDDDETLALEGPQEAREIPRVQAEAAPRRTDRSLPGRAVR